MFSAYAASGAKGFSRHGRERNADTRWEGRPTTPFRDLSLRGWARYIYVYTRIYTYRRGKAKEQDEDEGRKKRVAMTRHDGERKRNDGEGGGASGAVTKTKKEEEELLFGWLAPATWKIASQSGEYTYRDAVATKPAALSRQRGGINQSRYHPTCTMTIVRISSEEKYW